MRSLDILSLKPVEPSLELVLLLLIVVTVTEYYVLFVKSISLINNTKVGTFISVLKQ